VKDKKPPGQPKKFEDQQLQALLDEDACQTQKQLAERLNVAQQTISDRLQAMGKILKEGKWVSHQLNERQMKNRKVISEMLLQRHKRKSFLHQIVTMENGFILRISNAKNHGLIQVNHQHRLQGQIASERRQCSAFGGIRKVWCIMSF